MKFAIVLLACLAFAAAIPQERGIIEKVESVVSTAISKAHSDLDSIISLVQGLTSNAQGKIGSIIAGAKNQIGSTVAGLESTISGLISKGGAVAVCAQQNLGELSAFKTTIGKNVESCAGTSASAIGNFESSVLAEVSGLKSAITELVTIVEECSTNALEAVLCAVTKVGEVEKLVGSIVSQASTAVESARGKATTVIGAVQTCATQVIGEATITLNKYVASVKQCA